MSQLTVYGHDSKEFKLNVTQFRSPMNAQITSAQTKKMLHHFPIRCGQPDISFTVRYANLVDKHAFESFVRQHQLNSHEDKDGEVTLWWPQRNIDNWTGYITAYSVAEKRFETAPAATFGVMLVDSMMSEKTTLHSAGIDVAKILGIQIPAYTGYGDTIIVPPSRPSTRQPINPQDRARNSGDIIAPPPYYGSFR